MFFAVTPFQQQLEWSDCKKLFLWICSVMFEGNTPTPLFGERLLEAEMKCLDFPLFQCLIYRIYYLRTPWTLHCICVSHVSNTVAAGVFRRNVSNGEQQACSDYGRGRWNGGQRRPRRNAGKENTRWSESDILISVKSVNSQIWKEEYGSWGLLRVYFQK